MIKKAKSERKAGMTSGDTLDWLIKRHDEMLAALREVKAVFEASGAQEPFKDQYMFVCQAIANAEAEGIQ